MEYTSDFWLVLGTWFSGIIAAIAIVFSVWISNRKYKQRIELHLKNHSSGLEITLINIGEVPITISAVGIFLDGVFHDLKQTHLLILQPNNSKELFLESNLIKEIIKSGIVSGNKRSMIHYWNSMLFVQRAYQKGLFDKVAVKNVPYYHFKFAVKGSGSTFVTKKWLNVFSLPHMSERGNLKDTYFLTKNGHVWVEKDTFFLFAITSLIWMLSFTFEQLYLGAMALFAILMMQGFYIHGRMIEGNATKSVCFFTALIVVAATVLFISSTNKLSSAELIVFGSFVLGLFVFPIYNVLLDGSGLSSKHSLTVLVAYLQSDREENDLNQR